MKDLYQFDDIGKIGFDALRLSRSLPDPRGGIGGFGSVPEIVTLTRSVKVSAARCAEWAASAAASSQ